MKQQAKWYLCLTALLSAGAVTAEPVAMVTDISSGVFTVAKNKSEKVPLLSCFEPGTVLRLDANAHLTVTFLAKSIEYRFTGPARLTVEKDRVVVNEGKAETHAVSLQKASAARKFTAAQRESVTIAAFEMRTGARAGLRLDDPVDSQVLGSPLIFNWDGPPSIHGYQLNLFDGQGKLVYQAETPANSWTLQEGLLKAGKTYDWEISAVLAKGETLTARARFGVAEPEAARQAQEQRPVAAASFSERVLYAIYLEEHGFKYDARRLWKELSKERPDDMVAKEHATR